MIRPKIRAIKSQGAALERHSREILDIWRLLPRIEPRDAPIFIPLLRPAQDVNQSIDKDMAAYLKSDIDNTQNAATRIEF